MTIPENKKLTYKDAGVDIEQASTLVENIKSIAKRTHRPGILAGIGGFGALFELPLHRFKEPVLVSGTDGVGTKLKIAISMHKHDTIGIDLVAMCVNDIVTSGAEPLFFLDYFATGKLNPEKATDIIAGIGKGCEQAGAALIGGETAEMPGMYQGDEYDLAGFAVGIVEKSKIINGSSIADGDQIIALASSGLHSNGFSLVRRILQLDNVDLTQPFDGSSLGEVLLRPTRIYVKTILNLAETFEVKGIAHITGGGLLENIPRILPENTQAVLHQSTWEWPSLFHWLQSMGNVADEEMLRTFNCGVGMVIVVAKEDTKSVINMLKGAGERAWHIGEIKSGDRNQVIIQ